MTEISINPPQLQNLEPLHSDKLKKIYAPKGMFQLSGKLASGINGTISGDMGQGFCVYKKDNSLELVSPDEMAKYREKAAEEAEKTEDQE